jgi:hypothetical protein
MEIDMALLADAATVDASGKLNILGVFDRISTGGFPAQHPHISLVLRFVASLREAGRHSVRIRLRDESGTEIMHVDGELHIGPGPLSVGGQVRIPQVVNIGHLVFPKAGHYGFDVLVDGTHQVSIPLTLDEAGPRGPVARA